MTRKGKLPIDLPKGIELTIKEEMVLVKGPKGALEQKLMPGIIINKEEDKVLVQLDDNHKENRKYQGLYRTLVDNMIVGTLKGFEKRLKMIGTGYRSNVQGTQLNLQVGFSHPTLIAIPEGISVLVEKNTTIVITGADRQKVGQFAASIRSIRPPEPYKGKGIRYEGEFVRKKAGKTASKK